MKNLFSIACCVLFATSTFANNLNVSPLTGAKQCLTTIATDCDGDGEDDYENTVDCQYASDIAQQQVDACNTDQQL